ncbi:MAG: phosphotransferase [Natronohydrobacter sp.]|nr:phosphotransferase [Natronohydrobacter sp.]
MQPTDTDRALTETLLQIARNLPHSRLSQITHDGKTYFVKRPEQHASLRWRAQKGDPKTAFSREVALLQGFAARGAAVARIVAADDGLIVLADHGKPLHWFIYLDQADNALMQRAGAALADLHRLGLAHGRPSLRDICWDGGELTFLDLEAGARLNATPRNQARDLYLLLHSVFTTDGAHSARALPVLESYISQGDPLVWEAAKLLAQRLWWVDLLSRPVVWWHRFKGKKRSEFAAIGAARRLILDAR